MNNTLEQLNKTIDELNEKKDKIKAFMILAITNETLDENTGSGINSSAGKAFDLYNLYLNIDERISRGAIIAKKLQDLIKGEQNA